MTRLALALILAALSPRPVAAQPSRSAPSGDDGIFGPLSEELGRTMRRLEMGRLGKPYFASYTVEDSSATFLWSTFGALRDPRQSRSRLLKAILRVGSARLDNSHYVAKDFWNYRPPVERLVVENDRDALRFAAWALTDEAYKAALQTLSQKKAYRKVRMIKEEALDLSDDPAQSFSEAQPAGPFDQAAWGQTLRGLSAKFRGFPAIQRSGMGLSWTSRRLYFLDSEGRRSVRPADEAHLTLEASAQAEDGMELSDRRRIVAKRLGDLPSGPALAKEVERLAEDISALARAPLMEPYIGPVLLEGQAAGEFFNQLLARGLSNPRALWTEDEGAKDRFRAGELSSRLGLRVLSPFLSAIDDPTLSEFSGVPLAGSYPFDDQGIPARRVALVEKGILKDVLMSRSPIKERMRSNGHGRGGFFEFPTGRPGNLIITAEKTLSEEGLKAELIRQAREFGLRYGLVVRRIGEEDTQEEGEPLAPPVLLYRVYVDDGREELVRNAQFSGVTLRALRDIVAASDKPHVYNFFQLGPYRQNRGEVQASIVHPSILVSEMELKRGERKPEKLPYLPHPYFASGR